MSYTSKIQACHTQVKSDKPLSLHDKTKDSLKLGWLKSCQGKYEEEMEIKLGGILVLHKRPVKY
jgi:hypothetical protein